MAFMGWCVAWVLLNELLIGEEVPADFAIFEPILRPGDMVVSIITFVFGFLLTLRAAAALKRFKTGGEQYNNLLGNVIAY